MTIAEREAVHLLVMQRALDGTGAQVRVDTDRGGARILRWVKVTIEAAVLVLGCALSASAQPIIINHDSYPLFDQIPPAYLVAALNTKLEFADASVGDNVKAGFDCLRLYANVSVSPNGCKTIRAGLPVEDWAGPYDLHVTYNWYPGQTGVPDPMTGCPYNGLWTGMVPCWRWWMEHETALGVKQIASYDVVGPFPNYNYASWSDPMANFWINRSGDYDAYDLLNYQLSIAPKKVLWIGSSIMKGTDTVQLQRLADYNAAGRAFAAANNLVYLDMGDIESHNWDGTLASYQGIPIIAPDWTAEGGAGGHLSYGAAKVRMAKLWIVALARMAGWDGLPETPPPPPPQDTEPPTMGVTYSTSLPSPSIQITIGLADNVNVTGAHVYIQAYDAAGNVTLQEVQLP